jgi:transmembrane sensor
MEPNNPTEREAADWVARRDAGDLSPAESEAFETWLNSSTLNRVEFLRAEDTWEATLRLKALGAGVNSITAPPPGRWSLSAFFKVRPHEHGGAISRRWPLGALAATAAIVVVALGLWATNRPSTDRYLTAVGRVTVVPLPDGSRITLNTDTRIRVTQSATLRQVDLERGEAFFEVVHDKTRPFVVRVGNERITAVGTQFSVRRGLTHAEVIVTEGQVRVESDTPALTSAPQILNAGSIAQASDAGTLVQLRPVAQTEELLSWRRGLLVFQDATLTEAAAEFNRYNTRQIRIADPTIGALRVAGTFRATNVEAFARLLERGYPLRAEFGQDEVVLTPTKY